MSQDYAPAKWIGTSHFWAGRSGYTPKWIIVHGTAGGANAEEVGYYFQTNDPPTSTHYVVGLNGEVVQCVSEGDTAWGNGIVTDGHDPWWSPNLNPNFLTFSVEHVKPSPDNSDALTPAQKAASFALIKHLCERHNIPMRRADANGGIAGHNSIDPVSRSFCPGPYPWDELIAYLNNGGNSGANNASRNVQADPLGTPDGWRDDGQRLIAPNGEIVSLGFRWYVLNHPWQADNWPLEREHYADPLDVTNPDLGAGTIQHFRQSILAWRESTGDILELWPGAIALRWEETAQVYERRHPTAGATASSASSSAQAGVAAPRVPNGAPGNAGNRAPGVSATRGARSAQAAGATTLGAAVGAASAAVAVGATRNGANGAGLANDVSALDDASLQGTLRYHPSPNGAARSGLALRAANVGAVASVANFGNESASDEPQASGAGHGATPAPRGHAAARTAGQPARQTTEDPLTQRLTNLEQQIQALTQGMAPNGALALGQRIEQGMQGVEQNLDRTPQGRALDADLQRAAGVVERDLANPKTRRGLTNPRTLLRWTLMIIGLLFSDAIAWAITTFSQHPGAFPIPFLTVGTVFSGVIFVIAARLWV